MDIKFTKQSKISDHKMPISYSLKGSNVYNRAKLMAIMSLGERQYYNHPFRKHIEDIEQTLIDYGFENEDFFTSIWVSNCDIPFKKKLEMFGKDIVRLSYGFNRTKRINESLKGNTDVVTLNLAQRISNINYSINNQEHTSFDLYVKTYDKYRESFYSESDEHEKMWKYLDFCCIEVADLNSFFFFF